MLILKTTVAFMFVLLSMILQSCAAGRYPIREPAVPSEITGSYSLILYGGRHIDDIENVAILDKEGDNYAFTIYAPEYDYTIRRGVTGKVALEEAERFVRFHRSFLRSRLSRIIDNEGNTVGYEIRPLYHIFEFGYSDVLYIDYRMKGDQIIVTIRQIHELEHRAPLLFMDGWDD